MGMWLGPSWSNDDIVRELFFVVSGSFGPFLLSEALRGFEACCVVDRAAAATILAHYWLLCSNALGEPCESRSRWLINASTLTILARPKLPALERAPP